MQPHVANHAWILAPILAQAILLEHCIACACGELVFVFFCVLLHPHQPWQCMPRKGWTALETPNGWFQLIRGPSLHQCVGRRFPNKSNVGVVETPQRSGSSAAVSAEDSHHEGRTASERECASVSPRTKVEDIGVEAFPRSGFQSRRMQRQSFEIGTGSGSNGRQRGSRGGWPSSSTRESQSVRKGSASGQTDQGWRAVLDQN